MTKALPGQICPETGVWTPSDNPTFYPTEYADRVMKRHIKAGEVMPKTPHGEPSWILQEEGRRIQNFNGLSPDEIMEIANSQTTQRKIATGIILPIGHEVHVRRTSQPTKIFKIRRHDQFEDSTGNIFDQTEVLGEPYDSIAVIDPATGRITTY
ncbi:hypothetical protein [Burkholderia gladioli]|uniref:hypothetical protein n=1 Tax=Burkholderia gladioli TaxID=28095 RepID=UPI001640AAC8|nr:hypothetical protein [Burkholderia gladioli]